MKNTYQSFLKQGIDLAPVGVCMEAGQPAYFCTPKGATIFGWAGVDGIHYCFVRGFGEMVFAVSPMNPAPEYVHPLAKTFTDFLRLLLACGDAAALEQAWMWDKAQFEAFVHENPPSAAQKQTLAALTARMHLAAMEQPWEYLKALQASFDCSKIKYTEDFYDPDMNPAAAQAAPPWEVFYDGGFWGRRGKGRPGTPVAVQAQFAWAGRQWQVPAVYLCGKGLVVDVCMQAGAASIRAFMEKWSLDPEQQSFTREQRLAMERENPLEMDFCPEVELNGRPLRAAHGYAECWNPCLPGGAEAGPARRLLAHYGLDAGCGWVIYRHMFPWPGRRRPAVRSLALTLTARLTAVPGPRFWAEQPGAAVTFRHPADGSEHTLTVQQVEQQTLPAAAFGPEGWDYPTHCRVLSYTVCPDITDGSLSVEDCAEGDRPRPKPAPAAAGYAPAACASVCAAGVIGGADGPTVLLCGADGGGLHAACSALRFAPPRQVEWRVMFHVRLYPAARVGLLPAAYTQ